MKQAKLYWWIAALMMFIVGGVGFVSETDTHFTFAFGIVFMTGLLMLFDLISEIINKERGDKDAKT